jgi:flavodoxin
MKILVAYYSRTNLSKKIATIISEKLKADLDEIIDKKSRSGAKGYIIGGRDAIKRLLTKISYKLDPKEYDLVIIGGPVWAWTISPAIRTYMDKNSDSLKIKKLAFFATQGSNGAEKKFEAMKKILKTNPECTLIINSKDFRGETYNNKIEEFLDQIKKIR